MKTVGSYLTEIDELLSRTAATGRIDLAASPEKLSSMREGDDTTDTHRVNLQLIVSFINWRALNVPSSAVEMFASLTTLAHLTNMSLTPSILFRHWPYAGKGAWVSRWNSVEAHAAPAEMWRIIVGAFENLHEPRYLRDLVAGLEWDIGIGPVHPFYDGCGRISRYFTALIAMWTNIVVPLHGSRDEYMHAAGIGRSHFVEYWKRQPYVRLRLSS